MTVLCLGEAIVDLVCERELDSLADADSFKPRFGGALANVVVAARRAGAAAALAGGAGDDEWGWWLRAKLRAEEVDLRWFALVPGLSTPVAFVAFDRDREPMFRIYGDGIEAGIRSLEERLPEAIASASALVHGSNTLVGERERTLTLRARDLARERGLPVLFDPNLRDHRWSDPAEAVQLCRRLCDGILCVRTNLAEGRRLAGLDEAASAERAAEALCALGARIAVVTRGPDGAVMRGAASAEQDGVAVETASSLGAGDAFTGALAAGLAQRGWEAGRAAEALPAAVEAASRVCAVWEAVP
jgi:sugar/nucleoside kinase (ribokinase family)